MNNRIMGFWIPGGGSRVISEKLWGSPQCDTKVCKGVSFQLLQVVTVAISASMIHLAIWHRNRTFGGTYVGPFGLVDARQYLHKSRSKRVPWETRGIEIRCDGQSCAVPSTHPPPTSIDFQTRQLSCKGPKVCHRQTDRNKGRHKDWTYRCCWKRYCSCSCFEYRQ
jgi:hypothetical protein